MTDKRTPSPKAVDRAEVILDFYERLRTEPIPQTLRDALTLEYGKTVISR